MVEGGAGTHRAFLESGLVDELVLFVAPSLFGADGLTWSGALDVHDPKKAPRFGPLSAVVLGGDVMLTARRAR
jgi:riboflavin biosynthesis pyrimidine reductase